MRIRHNEAGYIDAVCSHHHSIGTRTTGADHTSFDARPHLSLEFRESHVLEEDGRFVDDNGVAITDVICAAEQGFSVQRGR